MCDWVKYAKAGDPVVCVSHAEVPVCGNSLGVEIPKIGSVYVLRDILIDPGTRLEAVRLRGVVNPIHHNLGEELAYWANWFRPATSTDLPASIREALKTPAPKEKVNV